MQTLKLWIVVSLFITSSYAVDLWDGKVKIFGNLEETLTYQGSGDSISLKQFQKTPNLYGIGLSEFLQNEVLLIDTQAFISSAQNKRVAIDNSFNHQLSFFVSATVPVWEEYKVPNNIFTKKQFEEFLEELADEEGIDTFKPFPFMIEGKVKASRYRVFSHNKNDTIVTSIGTCASCNEGETKEGSKKRYLSSTLYDVFQDKKVTVLGFFYYKRGIVTTKDSYTNLNFISKNKRLSGHMQNMMVGEDMILKLPKLK